MAERATVRLTFTPTRAAAPGSSAQARQARPKGVRAMSSITAANARRPIASTASWAVPTVTEASPPCHKVSGRERPVGNHCVRPDWLRRRPSLSASDRPSVAMRKASEVRRSSGRRTSRCVAAPSASPTGTAASTAPPAASQVPGSPRRWAPARAASVPKAQNSPKARLTRPIRP